MMPSARAFGVPPPGGDGSVRATAFKLTFTDERFRWAGETRRGTPLLRWPDGTVCEPVLLHFGHAAARGRIGTGSMRVEAYVVRAWLAFLWRRGKRWDEADDQLLRDWREEQRAEAAGLSARSRKGGPAARKGGDPRPPSRARIERKVAVVFKFYETLPAAMRRLPGPGEAPPRPFVGAEGCAIGCRAAPAALFRGDAAGTCWAGAERAPRKRVRRAPLEPENVVRLLAHVRDEAAATPTRRPTASAGANATLECERDWLIARCEAEAGLRADEVAHLALSAIAAALAEEGIGPGTALLRGTPDALAALAGDAAARNAILSGLDRLAAAGRCVLGIEVTCKGRTRRAPFPIALVRDLLDIATWTVRDDRVRNRETGGSPPLVFLSSKTGRGLLPGSVVDLMGDAFDALGLAGGGHRLRARFATDTALRLVEQRLALNGWIYDRTVETWVLEQVREALGHASIDVTVKHYVDRALMRLLGAPTKGALAKVLDAHRALSARGGALGARGLALVRDVIEELARDRGAGASHSRIRSALSGRAGDGKA